MSTQAPLSDEPTLLVGVMEELSRVQSRDEFVRCTGGSLQCVFPHEMMFSAIGRLTDHGPRALDFVSHNFPLDFIMETQGPNGEVACRLFDYWLETEEPQFFQPERDAHRVSKLWLSAFRKFDLRNMISFGVKARSQGELSTYFSFARVTEPLGVRYLRTLKLLGPHIHLALKRMFAASPTSAGPTLVAEGPLSERQREVLRWVRLGKTNWEIAKIIGVTEKGVKYHLGQIFQKLQVANRTQAVVKAVSMKIIE